MKDIWLNLIHFWANNIRKRLFFSLLALFFFIKTQAQIPTPPWSEFCCPQGKNLYLGLKKLPANPDSVRCLELTIDRWLYNSEEDYRTEVEKLRLFPHLECLSFRLVNAYEYPAVLFELKKLRSLELLSTIAPPPANLNVWPRLERLFLSYDAAVYTPPAFPPLKQLGLRAREPMAALARLRDQKELKTVYLASEDATIEPPPAPGAQFPPIENLTWVYPRLNDEKAYFLKQLNLKSLTLVEDTVLNGLLLADTTLTFATMNGLESFSLVQPVSPERYRGVLETLLPAPTLKTLRLTQNPHYNRLPHNLETFTALEVLDLSGCGFTDIPPQVGRLKSLKTLILSGNPIAKEKIEAYRQQFPYLNLY